MNSSIQTKVIAGQLFVVAAQKISASYDIFSGWLIAGFGAGLILLVTNLDTVNVHLKAVDIDLASILFLASAVLATLQKLIAAFVAGGTAAGIAGATLGKDLANQEIELDLDILIKETKNALYWPGQILIENAYKKVQSGDFASFGRMYLKACQLQAAIIAIQAILLLITSAVILNKLVF